MRKIKEGDIVCLSGDSSDLWISGYNVRVSSLATVVSPPSFNARKVMVCIDEIDGDHNVCAYVRRSKLLLVKEDT